VDSAVDAARVPSLALAMPLPVSLIPDRQIVVSGRQPVRTSLLPDFEGDAVRFEDFLCRRAAEVSPPLIRCSRATEQSAVLYPANPWNRLLAVPIKLNHSSSDALLQMEKGGIAVEFRTVHDNEVLSRLQTGAVLDFFDTHWFPLKGNREVFRDSPLQETGSLEAKHNSKVS